MNEPVRARVVLNVGCGVRRASSLPACFDSWKEIRVDSEASVLPDVIADLTDLSSFADASAHAVWAAHCMEHLYEYQIPIALSEFRRVLRNDGFVCVIVPDLQTVAGYIAQDRLHEPLYQSAAGPVTPHDVLFGFGPAIASGQTTMAHHCGFTPSVLQRCFNGLKYGEIIVRRRSGSLELAAVARVTAASSAAERATLMASLQL
ncbi:MAG TPA: methyltransferase domain-containing protein [Steroidobacteraceae bacterium]|nr:methyltransferase domain-containing protein [Steroidobacteraceae bacterium]